MNVLSLIGSRLGKYEIRAEIGKGGMGTVYLGHDLQLDRSVAVKVLAPHLVWEQDFVERFLREARAAARLRHPTIVTIHDVGQEGGWYYFVMEHLEGQTLDGTIRRHGPLAPDRVIAILRPLADALDYAHHHGVVHRDIKSGNVIISPSGRVTLTDFGIARATQETRLTTTGAVVGTPEYMSPEQAKGLTVGAQSDQYSLAVVTFEMLSGQVPFRAESTLALLYKIAHEPPPSIRQARPDLPPDVEKVLNKALAKDPGDRYATVIAFVDDLERALAGQAVQALTPAQSPVAETMPMAAMPATAPATGLGSHAPQWVWVAGGLIVIAACGLLALVVGRGLAGNKPTPTVVPTAVSQVASTPVPAVLPTHTPQVTATPAPTLSPTPRYPSDLAGRIVFARKSVPWSNDTSEIWALDLSTDTATQLTHNNAVDWNPDWSPDGSHITFTTNRKGNYDIWVMNADGSEQKPWITLQAWDDYPRYSPDGTQVAFASTGMTDNVPNSEIFVGSSNSRLRRMTFNKGADEWPSWSPDGRWLACSSNREGYIAVFVFAVNDNNIKNWTADTTFSEQPAWSPDGEWIAFIRKAQTAPGEPADFGDVWIGKRDRSEFRQLTQDGYALNPAWSPDGHYIVFSHHYDSTGDGQVTPEDASELWSIPVEGGNPIVLTTGKAQDLAPRWIR